MKALFVGVAVVIAAGFASLAAAEGLVKCVDADGKVSYGDQACGGGAAASRVDVPSGAPPKAGAGVAVTKHIRMLQTCDLGKKTACYEKELLEKRCGLEGKGRGAAYSECTAYAAERKQFRELVRACNTGNHQDACLTLACAGGDESGCERMARDKASRTEKHDKWLEKTRGEGLPTGKGWFMTQDWHAYPGGEQAAIVTCGDGRTSVALRKRPHLEARIYTSMTGQTYFATVGEAARAACGKVK